MENKEEFGLEIVDYTGKTIRVTCKPSEWARVRAFYKQKEIEITPERLLTFLEDMKK
jgi:hypothetical protein